MKKKNYNCRTCLVTHKKYPKQELIRICKIDNKLVIDKNNALLGRGYYLSKTAKNLDPVVIKKILEKKTLCTDIEINWLNELMDLLQK